MSHNYFAAVLILLLLSACGGSTPEEASDSAGEGNTSSGSGSTLVELSPVLPGSPAGSLATGLWVSPGVSVLAYGENSILVFAGSDASPTIYTGFLNWNGLNYAGNFRTSSDISVTSATATVTPSGQLHLIASGIGLASEAAPLPRSQTVDSEASIAVIAGSYRLSNGDAFVLNSSGSVQSEASGCTASGSVATRESGKSIYRISVTMGGPPCTSAGAQFNGILFQSTPIRIIGAVSAVNRSPAPNLFLERL